MESLIIFIIFIIFSVIRTAAETAKKSSSPQRGSGGPVAPPPFGPFKQLFEQMNEQMNPKPAQPKAATPPREMAEYYGMTVQEHTTPAEELEPAYRKERRLKPSQQIHEQADADKLHAPGNPQPLWLDKQDVVKGIIYAEVLGRPRALKPWGRR